MFPISIGISRDNALFYMNSRPVAFFRKLGTEGVEPYFQCVGKYREPAYVNRGFAEARGKYVAQSLSFENTKQDHPGDISAPSATDAESEREVSFSK